jgi:hypothetical protein
MGWLTGSVISGAAEGNLIPRRVPGLDLRQKLIIFSRPRKICFYGEVMARGQDRGTEEEKATSLETVDKIVASKIDIFFRKTILR